MSLEIGTQVGDYRILGPVGAGAYGEVFQAEHLITHRVEALKILSNRRPGNSQQSQRFIREIQLQASLSHPNIAAVHNAFWTGDGLAMVMELVRGEPLSAILRRGRVALVPGVSYVLGTLSALAYAHSRGIVHRDIKPENIIITPDGAVKLTDFGLARSPSSPRLTHSGEFAGSPSYMSPEQVLATGEIGAPSDIYSTGVVLYEIVTGRPPFPGDTPFTVMLGHQSVAPVPPSRINPAIPPALDRVILIALQKDPERRFRTATEFQIALHHAAMLAVPGTQRRALALIGTAAMVVAGAAGFWLVPQLATRHAISHQRAAAAVAARPQPAAAAPDVSRDPAPAPLPVAVPATLPPAPSPEPMAAIPEQVRAETPKRPLPLAPHPPKKRAPQPAEPLSQLPRFTSSAEGVGPEPTLTPQPKASVEAEVALPTAIAVTPPEPAPVPPADPSTAPVKQRNAVVRTLGRIFHGKKPEPQQQ